MKIRYLASLQLRLLFTIIAECLFITTMASTKIGDFYFELDSSSQTASLTYQEYSESNYSHLGNNVVIPANIEYDGVRYSITTIDWAAFRNCANMTSVTIPNTVTSINSYAFENCIGLTCLELPNSVTTIKSYAFENCSNLAQVSIPESISYIGGYSFNGCTSLISLEFNAISCTFCGYLDRPAFPSTIQTLKIGNNVTTIPSYFLYTGSKIQKLTIPSSVSSIGNCALQNCSELKDLVIPEAITQIGDAAFKGCDKLTNLTFKAINCLYCGYSSEPAFPVTIETVDFGDNVSNIPANFLTNCLALHQLSLPESLVSIGSNAFENCIKLTSVIIPENVTSIGSSAFKGCTALINLTFNSVNCNYCGQTSAPSFPSIVNILTIGEKVTFIPDFFLCNGSNIQNITIPNAVKSIGKSAFKNSLNLKSVMFGAGLSSIEGTSFLNCNIIKAFWLGNTPPIGYDKINARVNYVSNNKYTLSNQNVYQHMSSLFTLDGIIYLPISPSDRTCDVADCIYITSTPEKIIADKVEYKGIQFTVVDIKPFSFYNNTEITKLTISNQGDVCQSAFSDCVNLKEVSFGDKVFGIGDNAFYNCSSLESIDIPNSAISLGKYTFSLCRNLEHVNTGSRISSFPVGLFNGCSSLATLSIPNSVCSIENYAFSGCRSLKNITFEESKNDESNVITLGCNGSQPLFSDCPLDEVCIGRTLSYNSSSSYGYSPFYRNTSLRSVKITDAETQIYNNEFYGCTNLQEFSCGDGVTSIGERAFSGCSALKSFLSGTQVATIGQEVFSDCTAMTAFISNAVTPPVCGAQALDDINKWECTLFVPAESKSQYKVSDQWKEFFFIEDSGVEDIVVDGPNVSNASVEIFSLSGAKVGTSTNALRPGIYIKRQGNRSEKFVVK